MYVAIIYTIIHNPIVCSFYHLILCFVMYEGFDDCLYLFLVQYLSEGGSATSLSDLKQFLNNRQKIRAQLIEDLHKKRIYAMQHTQLY